MHVISVSAVHPYMTQQWYSDIMCTLIATELRDKEYRVIYIFMCSICIHLPTIQISVFHPPRACQPDGISVILKEYFCGKIIPNKGVCVSHPKRGFLYKEPSTLERYLSSQKGYLVERASMLWWCICHVKRDFM